MTWYLQEHVGEWLHVCFSKKIADNKRQRNQRFLEEAIELFQAHNMSKKDALALVDYVYSRPKGDAEQEVGGVAITLLALCHRMEYDFSLLANREFDRISHPDVIAKIREKQDAKNHTLGISDQ